MKILVKIEEEKYEYDTPIDFPDTEQFMTAFERMIQILGYPENEVENYILDWAQEIKNLRDGKN
jgi:histone deacetylase complex regulatory component SIN3